MYKIMEKLGFPQVFIKMVSLLFHDASACVKLNGVPSPYFPIKRGVRQGCPLAPYLFLIVAEALNAMVSQEMRESPRHQPAFQGTPTNYSAICGRHLFYAPRG